ncbi:hypothetical protein [Streptomyces decoyicus]|uniref:hypothetical protein n=1 Tax=Streptomyces decoyicus TaxID=249567 RepID=UPI003870179E
MGDPIKLKPGSKDYRRGLRSELERLGLSEKGIIQQIAAELIRCCAVRPRTAWRLANELTLEQAAARFNDLSGDPNASMKSGRIWEYEQWPQRGARPSVQSLRTLGTVYGTPWNYLIDFEDIQRMPEVDRLEYKATSDGADVLGEGLTGKRRAPNTHRAGVSGAGSGARGAGLVPNSSIEDIATGLERSSGESLDLATLMAETNVDEEMIAYLHQELVELTHFIMRSSLHASFRRTVQLRDRVAALLRRRQRLPRLRELCVIAAKTCALLAWISEDLGHHTSAAAHVHAGWTCAEQADHNGARRWIRVVQSRMAFWAGDHSESARLAADGRDRSFADGMDSYLTLMEARAWSAQGETRNVLSLLSQWENSSLYEADPRSEDLFFNLTRDRQHYLAGCSLLLLNRNDGSMAKLQEALMLYGQVPRLYQYYGMEMITRIDTARACLRSGEMEAIPDIINPVLDVQPAQRLKMLRLGLRELSAEFAGARYKGSGLARDLDERIRGFCLVRALGHRTGQ